MAKKVGGKKPAKKKAATAGPPLGESYVLSDLEQIKVLADPLRVKLLESFCSEKTTKQVAEMLGEKSTKLYHHVEALERVGLIRLTRTRQNRGTLEKYYLTVARSFRVDPSLLPTAGQQTAEGDALLTMLSNMLDTVSDELRQLIGAGHGLEGIEEQGILTFCEMHATEAEMRKLRRRLERLVASLTKDSASEATPDGQRRFRFMLAFYPVDLGEE
jgi:hypothetical protein